MVDDKAEAVYIRDGAGLFRWLKGRFKVSDNPLNLVLNINGNENQYINITNRDVRSVWELDENVAPPIFLSYASEDRAQFVEPLVEKLRRLGYTVWYDRDDITAGEDWLREINRGLGLCVALVAILTPHAITKIKNYTNDRPSIIRHEHREALRLFRPVIPVLMEDCELPDYFQEQRLQYVDMRSGMDRGFDKLQQTLQIHLRRRGKYLRGEEPSVRRAFTGRERELGEIYKLMQGDSLAAITSRPIIAVQGTGGVGKTMIAEELLRRLAPRYPGGVIIERVGPPDYDEQGNSRSRNLASTILNRWAQLALGDRIEKEKNYNADEVRGLLKPIGALLVLVDDVWEEEQPAISAVLAALPPDADRIVTTRFRSVSNALGAELYSLSHFVETDSLVFLCDRLSSKGSLPPVEALKRLHSIVDGHALSLELTAGRIENTAYFDEALDELEAAIREKGVLDEIAFDLPNLTRDSSLIACLQLSYRTLQERDRLLAERFTQLGIIAPTTTYSRELVMEIWREADKSTTRKQLDRLIAAGLIEADSEKYHQHIILRAYALGLLKNNTNTQTTLQKESEFEPTFGRYADYYISLISRYSSSPFVSGNVQRVEMDVSISHVIHIGNELIRLSNNGTEGNLFRVLAFGLEIHNLRRTYRQIPFWDWDSMCLNATRVSQLNSVQYVNIGPFVFFSGFRSLEGLFLNNLSADCYESGNYPKALDLNEQALKIFRELGDRQFIGLALHDKATIWIELHPEDSDKVNELLNESKETAGPLLGLGSMASRLNNEGYMLIQRGQPEQALPILTKALKTAQAYHDSHGIASVLNNIGLAWDITGDKSQALHYYLEALSLYRDIHDKAGIARSLYNAGNMYFQLRNFQQAITFFEESISLYSQLPNTRDKITVLSVLANAYEVTGNLAKAIETLEECSQLGKGLNYPGLPNPHERLLQLRQIHSNQKLGIKISPKGLTNIIENTVAVMTFAPEERKNYHQNIKDSIKQAEAEGDANELAFFKAVLQLMEGLDPTLPETNPYTEVLTSIMKRTSEYMMDKIVEPELSRYYPLFLKEGKNAVRTALEQRGMPTELIELLIFLMAQEETTSSAHNIPEEYILRLSENTVAVKTEIPDKLDEWRNNLYNIREDFTSHGTDWQKEVEFVDALLGILEDKSVALGEENQYQPYIKAILNGINDYRPGFFKRIRKKR